jgi:hypothetical protein
MQLAYQLQYVEFLKLREKYKQQVLDFKSLRTEKTSMLIKINDLEERLLETQLQLERISDKKLTHMLSIQKCPTDKTGLGYVPPSISDTPFTSKTIFVKLVIPKSPPPRVDKGKAVMEGEVPIIPVSILASFCVWTKSLKCKDAINRDSTIQSDVRRFCLQVRRISSSLSAVWTIEPSHPDDHLSLFYPPGQRAIPSEPPRQISIIHPDAILYREGSIQLASVQMFQQHVRTPLSTLSVSDFFPSSKKGKINQPSGRCGIPSGHAYL